ncbi:hypothetical protein C8J57DRAFT_1354505 [Mycena rebaudengoi]|nr:hypothetical protein C8J57DRAFT_1354505 [Mycena rebaudengoi]
MSHPYSGSASYIYANEKSNTPYYSQTPSKKYESFFSDASNESLPLSYPPSGKTSVSSPRSLLSKYDYKPKKRPESQQHLIAPILPITHPYRQPSDIWTEDDEAVDESTPDRATLYPNRLTKPLPTKPILTSRVTFAPHLDERERARRAASWRRKIQVRFTHLVRSSAVLLSLQKRIRRALRRLRQFL